MIFLLPFSRGLMAQCWDASSKSVSLHNPEKPETKVRKSILSLAEVANQEQTIRSRLVPFHHLNCPVARIAWQHATVMKDVPFSPQCCVTIMETRHGNAAFLSVTVIINFQLPDYKFSRINSLIQPGVASSTGWNWCDQRLHNGNACIKMIFSSMDQMKRPKTRFLHHITQVFPLACGSHPGVTGFYTIYPS